MQAACPAPALEELRATFGVRLEVFASPLNCRFPRFCSAATDVDAPFGSLCGFFGFAPRAVRRRTHAAHTPRTRCPLCALSAPSLLAPSPHPPAPFAPPACRAPSSPTPPSRRPCSTRPHAAWRSSSARPTRRVAASASSSCFRAVPRRSAQHSIADAAALCMCMSHAHAHVTCNM